MAYIDDWGATPEGVRQDLIRNCADESCGHAKYRHGDARETRIDGRQGPVKYKAGSCELCRCARFFETPPITKDEVINVHEALESLGRLEDMFTFGQWADAMKDFKEKE